MRIIIRTDNEAFGENDNDRARECARILRELAARLVTEGMPPADGWSFIDANGNKVGGCAGH